MENNQYLGMFIEESKDHLQALNDNLLRLEENPHDISIVQHIFRSAHTLKGMSATMGFEDLASLTHEMENVLDLVRNEKLSMDDYIFDVLFQGLDALESMIQDIVEGGSGKADVSALVEKLKGIVKGDRNPSKAPSPLGQTGQAGHLDEYQLAVLKQSAEAGFHVLSIRVVVREDCVLKAARAYMVFDVLEKNGEVVQSFPSVEDIEQEKFDRSFSVYYITRTNPEELKKQLENVSELESVHVEKADPAQLEKNAHQKALDEAAAAAEMQAEKQQDKPVHAKGDKSPPKANAQAGSRMIRVDIERLDTLMNLFSELLIDRVRLEQLANEIGRPELIETVEHMARVSGDLQSIVLNLRMIPIETVFNRFPRMVRDLAKSLNKKVNFVISGAETELDRTIIDEIGDPLVHLLRNAVDHGIESVEERIAQGKPETGTLNLRAFHSGNYVFIEIEDDGKGINREKVLNKAIEKGVVTKEEAGKMSDQEVYQLLFASGFSTAEKVTDVSGRGVGLDVVKSKIESLGGSVSVESTLGKGSKFVVQLPLTLSIITALLIKLGSEKYAVPLTSIVETSVIRRDEIRNIHGTLMVEYRNEMVPLISLARVLDSPDFDDHQEKESEVLVIHKGDKKAVVTVDQFIGQQEVVIKSVGKYLSSPFAVSGATILGDGQVALILDTNALIKS